MSDKIPLEEKFAQLRALRDNTDDMELKVQITTYLGRMEQQLKDLKNNKGRRYIYILKVDPMVICSPSDQLFILNVSLLPGFLLRLHFQEYPLSPPNLRR